MPKKSSSKKQLKSDIEQAKPSSLNMPKKSSSKKPIQEQENADVEQAKPSSTPKRAGIEIDEIFSVKKRKKPEQKKVDKENVNGEEKPKSTTKKKKKSRDEEGRFTDPPSRSRKKTEDGFNVYTEEELGFNKSSGGVEHCPWHLVAIYLLFSNLTLVMLRRQLMLGETREFHLSLPIKLVSSSTNEIEGVHILLSRASSIHHCHSALPLLMNLKRKRKFQLVLDQLLQGVFLLRLV